MATSATLAPDRASTVVIRAFPFKRLMLSSTLLVVVALLGFLALDRVKRKAVLLREATLPRLTFAGMANSDLAEDFNYTLLMVVAETQEESDKWRAQADHSADQSKQYLDAYEKGATLPLDHQNFTALIQRRETYLAARKQVFALTADGKKAEAAALSRTALLPAYKEYKAAGETVLAYNIQQGELRGGIILKFCRIAQGAVVGCVIALFLLGFIIGVFK